MMGCTRLYLLALAGAFGVAFAGCGEDETGPELPGPTTVQIATVVDTVTVTWTAVTGVSSFRVELRTNPDTLRKTTAANETEAVFTQADGVDDDVTYTAVVYAINAAGATESSNAPSVLTDFFPWDDHYLTSLHATGQGKKTFYNASPNQGFERFTGIAYADLACKGCHEPATTGGCASCHDTDTPTLGATVDASLGGVCGTCHSRQKAEAITHAFSDVHRDAGMDCMDCHTLGDVHGDGTVYASMLEDGAIDTRCTDCHTDVSGVGGSYHSVHASTVDCSACHMQSVVTCNNCHFETEIQLNQKKAYGQFKNWVFLMNFRGKVYPANYQSVKYGDNTLVAMAPFYAHTIARNAVTCGDCHQNAAVVQWADSGYIRVVTWDPAQSKLTYANGRIPVPFDYLTSMRFDFVDLDQPGGTVWSFLEAGPDTLQIVYGSPLTDAQMTKLRQ